MVAYVDTSVLLRHILLGDSSIKHLLACERIISSELLEIESRRVIHRYRIDGEIDDEGFVKANTRLNEILSGISLLALSSAVKKRAMGAFPVHVKTLDALHIASALVYTDTSPEQTVLIFSYETGLNRCAYALGFTAPFGKN
ncbi:MAG TPA: PIN domain-containing protein [Sediminispirochaeta sp.]|nr:PIN domain-containing protein [Sediminispirochaeta sp.]